MNSLYTVMYINFAETKHAPESIIVSYCECSTRMPDDCCRKILLNIAFIIVCYGPNLLCYIIILMMTLLITTVFAIQTV